MLSMKKFIHRHFPELGLYEFTFDECKYCIKKIADLADKKDVILLPGGGFLGTLWPEEEDNVIHILKIFSEHRIIIFPQTLFFEDTKVGQMEKQRFLSAVKECKRLYLFLRDENSFFQAKKLELEKFAKLILVPDIVTWLPHHNLKSSKRKKILICLRNDREKTLTERKAKRLMKMLKNYNYEIEIASTVLEYNVSKKQRELEIRRKLLQFLKARLVLTDRLHGMIFSAITETPCIALDNTSKKVSGGYEWFRQFDYIKLVEQDEVTTELIDQLLSYKEIHYDSMQYKPYYEDIKNVLEQALQEKGEQ